ncbi:MAG: radical SAM protein, partial [Oscillospiraceae bacterium]
EVTPRCNFSCVHCYLRDHHQSPQLSYNEIIDIIDILYEKGVLFITFTGGEIFARSDFMDIYMYAKRKGFIIELFTNASLISSEIIDVLKTYPPLLVDVSLYGASEETYQKVTGVKGMFERVVGVCRQMKNVGIRVALKSPMITLTESEYNDMEALAADIGIPFRASFEIIPTIDNDSATQQYQLPVKEILRYEFEDAISNRQSNIEKEILNPQYLNRREERPLFRCKVGLSSCVIDYNGKLCPCMKFKHVGEKITYDSFDAIWEKFGEYSIQKASPNYKCLTCDAYIYCDICPAEMDFVYSDFEHIETVYCKMAKARKLFHEKHLSIENAISTLETV